MQKTHKIEIDDKIRIIIRPKSKSYEVYAMTSNDGSLLIETFKTSLQDAIDYSLNLVESKK